MIHSVNKEDTVRCNNCYWTGVEDELQTFVDLSDQLVGHDINYFKGCPECKTDDYLIDLNPETT